MRSQTPRGGARLTTVDEDHTKLRPVQELEARLESSAGLFVAGNGYHGIGVPDCIRMGKEAAERIAKSVAMQPLPHGRGSVT